MGHVTENEKKNKKNKNPKYKFYTSFNNVDRDPLYEYAWILATNVMCTFRGDSVWNFFSHINENEKKNIVNNEKSTESSINPLDRFQENSFNKRMKDDEHLCNDSSLAVQ